MNDQNIIRAVGVLVFSPSYNKTLLLVRDVESNYVSKFRIPAGKLNENETYGSAAIRLLREKTGLLTRVEDLVKLPFTLVTEVPNKGNGIALSVAYYLCKTYKGELDDSKVLKPTWVYVKELSSVKPLDSTVILLKETLDHLKTHLTKPSPKTPLPYWKYDLDPEDILMLILFKKEPGQARFKPGYKEQIKKILVDEPDDKLNRYKTDIQILIHWLGLFGTPPKAMRDLAKAVEINGSGRIVSHQLISLKINRTIRRLRRQNRIKMLSKYIDITG